MKNLRICKFIKTIFSISMIVSAIGEISLNETVVHSINIIDMPVYLLYLLGVLKIWGVMAIWFAPCNWIKEWAYAGFLFDFIGAIYSFVFLNQFPFPDIIMALIALLLCLFTYLSWKKVNTNIVHNIT